ncbi:hypothetical protein LCGC14_2939120, partial [marine sediment metagenome]
KRDIYFLTSKQNILRHLYSVGFDVHVVPASTPAQAVMEMKPDGIMFSNGPGDPEAVTPAIVAAKAIVNRKGGPPCPVMGICLGHQILGLALGGQTYKLKFGHHGGNHPVKDLSDGRVHITAQNHGYAIDPDGLRGGLEVSQVHLNDGTVEGLHHRSEPLLSIQYHSEASPGPLDNVYVFDRFLQMIEEAA